MSTPEINCNFEQENVCLNVRLYLEFKIWRKIHTKCYNQLQFEYIPIYMLPLRNNAWKISRDILKIFNKSRPDYIVIMVPKLSKTRTRRDWKCIHVFVIRILQTDPIIDKASSCQNDREPWFARFKVIPAQSLGWNIF